MLLIQYGNNIKTAPDYVKSIERIEFNELSKRTILNLKYLTDNWGFNWLECYSYKICKKDKPVKITTRKGYFIYGLFGSLKVTYLRKESRSSVAGQTIIYIGDFHCQVRKFINDSAYINDFIIEHQKLIPKSINSNLLINKHILNNI